MDKDTLMLDTVGKFFAKTAVSAARSLLLSEVKGGVKGFLNKKRAKSFDDLRKEMIARIGYTTSHYAVNKKTQELTYKSSAVFFHEWLMNSPAVPEKIMRDEESGHIYLNGELISSTKKLDLIERFVAATGVQSAALPSHLEAALKMIDLSDYNASLFKEQYGGWVEGSPSIIDGFLSNAFGEVLETDKEYASFLFRKWMVGTARRIMHPGSSFDGCLTLTGAGGTGKTGLFRNLLPSRTGEILCNVKNAQKFVESIKGLSISNFDELSVLDHDASTETFKQLLSNQWVQVRLAWAREPRRYNLRQGFCATTNKKKFIPDQFLSRRLWTIELNDKGRLDFDYLFANRDNLWREAVYLAEKNESCLLSVLEQQKVEAENAKHLL